MTPHALAIAMRSFILHLLAVDGASLPQPHMSDTPTPGRAFIVRCRDGGQLFVAVTRYQDPPA